jgi:CRP/FNR family transcriptional regulator/CRP/FNR family cyclic AMP-dependent transcriptional regulator
MTDARLVEQLGRCGLFAGVSKKGLGQIADLGKVMEFGAGEEVTVQAARGTRFHLVLDGMAEVAIDGRVRSTIGPGDTIGEMSLLDGEPTSATVRAVHSLRTLSLPSWNFRTLLRKEPTILEQVMLELVRRLRAATADRDS